MMLAKHTGCHGLCYHFFTWLYFISYAHRWWQNTFAGVIAALSPHKALRQFPVLVPFLIFYPHWFSCFTFHVSCYFTVSLSFIQTHLSFVSSVRLFLIFNVIPPFLFFVLDYDFGDMFPVLQSLPSSNWEGGKWSTLPSCLLIPYFLSLLYSMSLSTTWD